MRRRFAVHELEHVLGLGRRHLLESPHLGVDPLGRLLVQDLVPGVVPQVAGVEKAAQTGNRVPLAPLLDLFLGAVAAGVVCGGVVAEPVGRGGYRYVFLTPRRIELHEREFDAESLNYPFGIV